MKDGTLNKPFNLSDIVKDMTKSGETKREYSGAQAPLTYVDFRNWTATALLLYSVELKDESVMVKIRYGVGDRLLSIPIALNEI